MIRVTTGDALHLYGSVGRSNYSVRLCVRMDENINSEAIVNALKRTQKRYPYLCVRLKKMALDRQCTAYRGMTFLQSDEENVYKKMVFSSSRNKMVLTVPKIED